MLVSASGQARRRHARRRLWSRPLGSGYSGILMVGSTIALPAGKMLSELEGQGLLPTNVGLIDGVEINPFLDHSSRTAELASELLLSALGQTII